MEGTTTPMSGNMMAEQLISSARVIVKSVCEELSVKEDVQKLLSCADRFADAIQAAAAANSLAVKPASSRGAKRQRSPEVQSPSKKTICSDDAGKSRPGLSVDGTNQSIECFRATEAVQAAAAGPSVAGVAPVNSWWQPFVDFLGELLAATLQSWRAVRNFMDTMERILTIAIDKLSELIGRGPHLNPYLMSNYAPVLPSGDGACNLDAYSYQSRSLEPIDSLPAALKGGMYVALGPNPVMADPDQHWFDGDGCMHACLFEDVPMEATNPSQLRAFYTRTMVTTSKLTEELKAAKDSGSTQAADCRLYPRMGAMHGFKTVPYAIRSVLLVIRHSLRSVKARQSANKTSSSSSAATAAATPEASSKLETLLSELDAALDSELLKSCQLSQETQGDSWLENFIRDHIMLLLKAAVQQILGKMTANTAPLVHHGHLYALHELDMPHELRLEVDCDAQHTTQSIKLSTLGKVELGKPGRGGESPVVVGDITQMFTAHPKVVGPHNGNSWLAAATYNGGNTIPGIPGEYRLRLFRDDEELSEASKVTDVGIHFPPYSGSSTLPWQTMVHDVGTTEKYIVLINSPVFADMPACLSKDILAYSHRKSTPLRFGIIHVEDALDAGKGTNNFEQVRWYEAVDAGEEMKAFDGVMLHIAEAWETQEGEQQFVTVVGLVFPGLDLKRVVTDKPGQLYQFKLNVTDIRLKERQPEVLAKVVAERFITDSSAEDACGEFPMPSWPQAPDQSRYIFLGTSAPFLGAQVFDGLVKVDTRKRSVVGTIKYSRDTKLMFASGQPTFVSTSKEVDGRGYLITFVYDASEDHKSYMGQPLGTSELVVYDATNMSSVPVARVPLGVRVPYYFHALFATPEDVDKLRHRNAVAGDGSNVAKVNAAVQGGAVVIVVTAPPDRVSVKYKIPVKAKQAMDDVKKMHGPGVLHATGDQTTLIAEEEMLDLGSVYEYTLAKF